MSGNIFIGTSSTYSMEGYLDKGSYGRVCRGHDIKSRRPVAIKMISHDYALEAEKEAEILSRCGKLDSDSINIVKIIDFFVREDFSFIVLERLYISLWHFMERRNFDGMSLIDIRVIAQQMLVALDALKSIGLVHCDLKPDNIMLVDQEIQPFKVKLIDFGVATKTSNLWRVGAYPHLGFIAPEILMDFPFLEEGVDMWALGCSLAFLYLGDVINPVHCEYEALRAILKLVGQPSVEVLEGGRNFHRFFTKCGEFPGNAWRLKTNFEFLKDSGCLVEEKFDNYYCLESMNDILKARPRLCDPTEREDTLAFIDILKQMLTFDPARRIKPVEALDHNFITMKHLFNVKCYINSSLKMMQYLNEPESKVSIVAEDHVRTLDLYTSQLIAASRMVNEDQASSADVKKNDVIIGMLSSYTIEHFVRANGLGKIAKAREEKSNKCVALKMVKSDCNLLTTAVEQESFIFKKLEHFDVEKTNLIMFQENFVHLDHFCLVSEVWDMTLRDFIRSRRPGGLCVSEIQEVARQMLAGLAALKRIGLVHGNLNPDNIVLVDHLSKRFKVKLIEFGLAKIPSNLWRTRLPPNPGYSPPEVLLGVPYLEESVDMWSLGCVLAFLYLGEDLFSTECSYEALSMIVKLMGVPESDFLMFVPTDIHYFKQVEEQWELKTPEEYTADTGVPLPSREGVHTFVDSFSDLARFKAGARQYHQSEGSRAFISFLRLMLDISPADRITPVEAIKEKFLTTEYPSEIACEYSSKNRSSSALISPGTNADGSKKTVDGQRPRRTNVKVEHKMIQTNLSQQKRVPNATGNMHLRMIRRFFAEIINFFKCDRVLKVFVGEASTYSIEQYLDKGSYASVFSGQDVNSKEPVAIKVMYGKLTQEARREAEVLRRLKNLGSDIYNFVNILDFIVADEQAVLVLEKLDISLWHFMENRNFVGLCVSEIRVIAQQLLVALDALKSLGLVHFDLKPDNILFVNHKIHPFKIKLIDFGVATKTSNLWKTSAYPHLGYIAPEVLLDFPFLEEGVDMWALGCNLAFLYLGNVLNPTHCEYEALKGIIKLVGQPTDSVLEGARKINKFFKKSAYSSDKVWRLKTPYEYSQETGRAVERKWSVCDNLTSLDDLEKLRPKLSDPIKREDLKAFIHLLKQMMTFDPSDRIKPVEALCNDFITMKHLFEVQDYISAALRKMKCRCKLNDGDMCVEEQHPSALKSYLEEIMAASNRDGGDSPKVLSIQRKDVLEGNTVKYSIEHFLHQDIFEKVAVCREEESNKCVAVKIVKNVNSHLKNLVEGNGVTLQKLRQLHLDRTQLIKFQEHFLQRDNFCLVSEMWDETLRDFMEGRNFQGLPLRDIREIAQQMLETLEALKRNGLVHGHVKPDNIVLVNQESESLKVKLIEFGFAKTTSKLWRTKLDQNPGYSAPEVLLGVPYLEESVDVWCLGCVLVFLYIGRDLIPTNCDYEAMKVIVKLLGQPENELLQFLPAKKHIFKQENQQWRLKTPEEYMEDTGIYVRQHQGIYDQLDSINDLPKMRSKCGKISREDNTTSFIEFLMQLLAVTPGKRVSPVEALKHDFIVNKEVLDTTSKGRDWTIELLDEAQVSSALNTPPSCPELEPIPSSPKKEENAKQENRRIKRFFLTLRRLFSCASGKVYPEQTAC